jgi:preprotein translocase SecF subunit
VQAAITRLLEKDLKRTNLSFAKDGNGRGITLTFSERDTGKEETASPSEVERLLRRECKNAGLPYPAPVERQGKEGLYGGYPKMRFTWNEPEVDAAKLDRVLANLTTEFQERPVPNRLETFDKQLAADTQNRAMTAIIASWGAILLYLWFRFGNWTFGLAAVLCLVHDLFFTLGIIAFCHYIHEWMPGVAAALLIQDFKIDLHAVAALLTLVGYSVNDTIVVFDRIREVRGKNPELTPQMINDSVNQTLSRTLLTSFITWLVVFVLYVFGGEGVHLFAFVMVIGVIVGTYSSIYVASPMLLMFGEGQKRAAVRERQPQTVGADR